MNLRQLHTLNAILEEGSFSSAGDRIGLSHSAVSVQMQQLETELGVQIFNRATRPPALTAMGRDIAMLARDVEAKIDDIRATAKGRAISGSISIGFVSTTLQTLLPRTLNTLRNRYPDLQVGVKSGLSGDLSKAVLDHELDFAILSSPLSEIPDLEISEIAAEPLFLIGPENSGNGTPALTDAELLRSKPFISFNKRTWLGRQIAARLQSRGIHVEEIMEVDSLDAIERLVQEGFGVSIVPQRLMVAQLSEQLIRIPFCDPVESRKLVLIRHVTSRQVELYDAVRDILRPFATAARTNV